MTLPVDVPLESSGDAGAWMEVGCPEDQAAQLGCRPLDRIDRAMVAEDGPPPTFAQDGEERYQRAYRPESMIYIIRIPGIVSGCCGGGLP